MFEIEPTASITIDPRACNSGYCQFIPSGKWIGKTVEDWKAPRTEEKKIVRAHSFTLILILYPYLYHFHCWNSMLSFLV